MAYAYVTLVMNDPSYFYGALVLWYSLKKVGSKHDFVIMVTSNLVDSEGYFVAKSIPNVKIVIVNEANFSARQKSSKRFINLYHWLNLSFTKFQLFTLTQYDKVLFLDADMVVQRNPDLLFRLNTPAGICSSIPENAQTQNTYFGRIIGQNMLETAIYHYYGIRGCTLLLKPDLKIYGEIMKVLVDQEGYGDENLFIGPDERLISEFYFKYAQPSSDWTHIHNAYGAASFKKFQYPIAILHYVTEKPWKSKENWPDFKIWYSLANELSELYPQFGAFLNKQVGYIRFGDIIVDVPRSYYQPETPVEPIEPSEYTVEPGHIGFGEFTVKSP